MLRSLTTERLAVGILFVLLFAMAIRVPADPDLYWHLRAGLYQVDHTTVLQADVFSHTRLGDPWINVNWLSQVIIALVYRFAGGEVGLAVLTALLAAGGMFFVYRASPGSVYSKGLPLVIGAAAAAIFWSARPQMASFFLSAAVFYLLDRYRRQQVDRLWLIPVIVWLWGNLHGGYVMAFILLGGFIAGELAGHLFDPGHEHRLPWRGVGKLLLVAAIAAAVLVLNPHGLNIYRLPLETFNLTVLQEFIQEWASPDFHQRQTWPFILLLLGTLGLAGLSSERLDWTDFILLAGTGFLALNAARNIALFAVVATPVMARHLDVYLRDKGWAIQPLQRVSARGARLNALLLAVMVLAAVGWLAAAFAPDSAREAKLAFLPLDAIEYINETAPEGQMFNSYNWGGYLMFAAPEYLVYVDGRTDLYADEFILEEYTRVIFALDGWRGVLDAYDIGWIIIERGTTLASVLADAPGWALAYEDEQAVIFTRAASPEGA